MKCVSQNCENEGITPKGYCSHACYLRHQKNNKGWFKKGHIPKLSPENIRKFTEGGKLWKQLHHDEWIAICNRPDVIEKKIRRGNQNPRWKNRLNRKCNNCNNIVITVKEEGNVFCSRRCCTDFFRKRRSKNKLPDIIRKCLLCEKDMLVRPTPSCTRKFCSIKCHNLYNIIINLKYKDTSIEKKVEQILINHNILYEKQKAFWKYSTVIDFFIFPDICIYCDGDYWHSTEKSMIKDSIITQKLVENNYEVIRFWERDINNNIEFVEEEIISCVQLRAKNSKDLWE